MALGDQAGLAAVQALTAQLPGIEKFTDDERAALVAGIAGLLTQASSFIQADLAPIVEVAGKAVMSVDDLIALIRGGFTITATITPKVAG